MIEAGGEEPVVAEPPGMVGVLPGSNIDYDYRFQLQPELCKNNPSSCIEPRGKVMGGSSVLNGMAYVRGNKQDYDDWESAGNVGWNWKNVLKYFKKSENLLQVRVDVL